MNYPDTSSPARWIRDPHHGWPDRPSTEPPWSGQVDHDDLLLGAGRLAHLVLLDGRLVDSWTEPVDGTRWEHLLPARVRPVVNLTPDPYEAILDWLTGLCGSGQALEALTCDPLRDDGLDGLDGLDEELDGLLDRLRVACFDEEAIIAMRRATRLVLDAGGRARVDASPARLVAGVAWCVAKANGLFDAGRTTQAAVQHTLGLASGITTYGRSVERDLVGHLTWSTPGPRDAPRLLALGRPDLLVAGTRSALVAWRDRAHEGRRRSAGRHPCTACSPEA